jgi:hypothetical protein
MARPVDPLCRGTRYYTLLASQMAALATSLEVEPGEDEQLAKDTIKSANQLRGHAIKHIARCRATLGKKKP